MTPVSADVFYYIRHVQRLVDDYRLSEAERKDIMGHLLAYIGRHPVRPAPFGRLQLRFRDSVLHP